ncbi:MAG: ATP-binding protein [Cyanobacteria bacterium SZAS LIN-3]|nr:ATP-binding protein [Cyanobacteria bacterium SZAS LIN-3]MBS2010699.1 ATP-binding protein [Cyanobacteria bacterium SZAS TMP-1]
MLLNRHQAQAHLETALSRSSAVILIGPRQCGKTTMARKLVTPASVNYFDLEDPISLARLEQPMTALAELDGLIVIDEIQRRPDLFPILRVLIDRDRTPGRFLILGSASLHLLQQSSESLAGRTEIVELAGFSVSDVGPEQLGQHWLRGGFPLSYLANSEASSFAWRKNFIRTFLEGDVPQLQPRIPASTLRRFWTMLAHYHGQLWNAAELARSLGVGETSTRKYLDLLEDLFMVRQLKPWHENLKKRQVKAPKIYLRDSGLLHELLDIRTMKNLVDHPKSGASWEGYALEETLKAIDIDQAYFWATHQGAELDLLLIKDNLKYGVEYKKADAPRITPSINTALKDLGLEQVTIIYPGEKAYRLSDQVRVMPVKSLASDKVFQLVTGS